jgi:2-(1,2-epoxy-1,2-dihydrophenyl)acetyl-CoA isomerase
MSEACVEYVQQEEVALLRLKDPPTRNALSIPMVEELQRGLDRAARAARAVVITGDGRIFSSGASLSKGRTTGAASDRDMGAGLESHLNPLLLRLREYERPWITAVNGPAVGVGCSLALMGDLVICGSSARFLFGFRDVGLVPDGGAAYLLAAAVGRVRAMQLLLLGESLEASAAAAWGLVTRVCPDADLHPDAIAVAGRLGDGPAEATRLTRRIAWQALESPFPAVLAAERNAQRLAGRDPDFEEGVAAFLEKRPPKFRRS